MNIDPTKLSLSQGEDKVRINCTFEGAENSSQKLELKTAGAAKKYDLARDYSVDIELTIPANSYTWLTIE